MIPQHKDDGVTSELRATATADPANELQKAIRNRNLRFLGIAGYAVSVPGVPNQGADPLVAIHGVHVISGTSDGIASQEQWRLHPIASKYAERYNRLLYAYLIRSNDPAIGQVRREIDRELLRLERRDPRQDAEKAIRTSPQLIELPADTFVLPGIDRKSADALRHAEVEVLFADWPNVFATAIMTTQQRQRLARQVNRYIIPYNRAVFVYYARKMRR